MTYKGKADIVFCLDASSSMAPCFEAVRTHVGDVLSGLESEKQMSWDLRLDFVAHSCDVAGNLYRHHSMYHQKKDLYEALYQTRKNPLNQLLAHDGFFTSDINHFKRQLKEIRVYGDECTLVALDFALDFPWRRASECHRIVVMMTDEACETGADVSKQRSQLDALIEKAMSLHVMLFIVAPESEMYNELASADKCEYTVLESREDGLRNVDFSQLFDYIGKSVSQSHLRQTTTSEVPRGLFGQESWVRGRGDIAGE